MMKLISAMTLAAVISLPVVAFADKENCDEEDVQCTYFTGATTGKYLKLTMQLNDQKMTAVDCFDASTTISIDKSAIESGELHLGDTLGEKYSQCKDAACKTSVDLVDASFVIKSDGHDGFVAVPKFLEVKMHDHYGVGCKVGYKNSRVNYLKTKHK